MPTQAQYNTTTQPYREIFIKLEVLDFNYYVVDEISGLALSANFSINADSDIRRTCNISMMLKDDYSENPLYSYEYWKSGNPFWFDKYLRINIGIKDLTTNDIVWNNQGIYIIDEPTMTYSAEDNSISFRAVDLMAQLTGLRNGNLEGMTYLIPIGSSISSAMKSIIEEQGFYNYIILDPPQATTPYEIKVDAGGTSYNILKELRDINPDWEMFFDVDGTFIFQQIKPNYTADNVITPFIDMDTLEVLYSDMELNTPFTDVKNYIEVYGRTIETNCTSTTTINNNELSVKVDIDSTQLTIDSIYDCLVTIGDISLSPINLNTLITLLHVYDKNNVLIKNIDITSNPIRYNNYGYIIRITKGDSPTASYLGYSQPFGVAWEDNVDSPFYVGDIINGDSSLSSPTDAIWDKPKFERQVRNVLSGGEYDNIYSNELAMQRAQYELYLSAKLNDNIKLTIVPIYWIDVNQIIEYVMPNESSASYWLIKDISTDFSVDGKQTISAIKYYNI